MVKYKARRSITGQAIPRCQHIRKSAQCERAVYFGVHCYWHQPVAVEHAASIGSKGGKAGGESKVRGDSEYYQRISNLAVKARKAKTDSTV